MGEKYYVIGGASIFCARSVLEVWPIWPPHLERLFALSEAEFSKCSSTLLATYEEAEGKSQEPKSTKEVLEFLEVCQCSDVEFVLSGTRKPGIRVFFGGRCHYFELLKSWRDGYLFLSFSLQFLAIHFENSSKMAKKFAQK